MNDKIKKMKPFNWNLFSFLFAALVILSGIVIGYNNKVISILEAELSQCRNEKEALIQEIDPEWHNKFNEQKTFYENRINIKSELLSKLLEENDSLRIFFEPNRIGLLDSNRVIITTYQLKKVRLAIDGEKEELLSIIQKFEESINLYEKQILNLHQIDSLNNEIITVQSIALDSVMKEINVLKDDINSSYNKFSIILLSSVLILISIYILILYYQKKKKNI